MNASSQASRSFEAACCPLCGASSWRKHEGGKGSGFEWALCECGAVFKLAEPPAGDGPPSPIYDEDYFSRYDNRRRRRIAKSRVQILDALEVSPRGRLLEIGCSLGYTLEAARSLGLEACGVDVSGHAVEVCRRLGFDARTGDLHELPFEDATFALAVLKHVFEHTPRPREALAELGRVLVPGGAVFFAVPNVDYLPARRRPAASRFYRGEAGLAHHVYYSPATLARLVESAGFRVAGVHPCALHRRAGALRALLEAAALPFRVPARLVAGAFGLRKEFWLVAVKR